MPDTDMISKKSLLEKRMEEAKASLLSQDRKEKVTIVHHNDADGLSSGYVMKRVAERAGFATQTICLERTYKSVFEEMYRRTTGPVIVTDLGGSKEWVLQKASGGRFTLIVDHHETQTKGLMEIDLMEEHEDFHVVNCTLVGMSGDKMGSAASLAYVLGKKIDPRNRDLADIALLGSLGDRNHQKQSETGRFHQDSYDEEVFNESTRFKFEDDDYRIKIEGDAWKSGTELARNITIIGSIGYKEGGPAFCMEDLLPDLKVKKMQEWVADMRNKRAEAYQKAMDMILAGEGIFQTNDFFYFDSGDHFLGMGAKTIGDFCDKLIDDYKQSPSELPFMRPSKYILGAQKVERIKLLGEDFDIFDPARGEMVKVSIRTPALLQEYIRKGKKRKVHDLVFKVNTDYCDGCHELRGATILPRSEAAAYLQRFQAIIDDKRRYLK